MDWSAFLDPDRLAADALVGLVTGVPLALVFGRSSRLLLAVLVLCVGVDRLYPGGSPALVHDAVQPLRSLESQTLGRNAARDAEVEDATGERGRQPAH
jgi:hypothetical protein